VASSTLAALSAWQDEAKTRADRYSEAPFVGSADGQARERRPGEISVKAFVRKTLEGQNPREHPAPRVLNTCVVARDSRKG